MQGQEWAIMSYPHNSRKGLDSITEKMERWKKYVEVILTMRRSKNADPTAHDADQEVREDLEVHVRRGMYFQKWLITRNSSRIRNKFFNLLGNLFLFL